MKSTAFPGVREARDRRRERPKTVRVAYVVAVWVGLRAPSALFALVVVTVGTACGGDSEACSGVACSGGIGAPSFAGVRSIAPDRSGNRMRVSWAPATDDRTPADQLRYR